MRAVVAVVFGDFLDFFGFGEGYVDALDVGQSLYIRCNTLYRYITCMREKEGIRYKGLRRAALAQSPGL